MMKGTMANPITPVAPGFEWLETTTGLILAAQPLSTLAEHLFTTRQLEFRPHSQADDYGRLGAALGVDPAAVIRVRQVHGREVLIVRPGEPVPADPEADAIVSVDPARAIAVRIADCVPVLLADRGHRVVAAIHAGWRGTAAGVCGATLDAIGGLGVRPADLVAVVGPSIGPCCYQVDAAVRVACAGLDMPTDGWFQEDAQAASGPRWKLDLWQATHDQLVHAGMSPSDVHIARLCTADHLDVCYSYRREGAGTGRLVAAIRHRVAEAV
jgi:YfiH family protein